MKPTGYLLHEGEINGRAYFAVATLETENAKTGNMIQIWFLLRDENPVDAVKCGIDAESICSGCPFSAGRGCYVNVGQAPLAVWRSFRRGNYPALDAKDYASVFAGRKVRFGAYGNPTLLPLEKVRAIASVSAGWTGYFHDWRTNAQAAEYGRFFMVSTETQSSFRQAIGAGFRVFHVSPEKPDGLIECLSDAKGLQCADCKLCDGRFRNVAQAFRPAPARQLPSVWINPHGSKSAKAAAVALSN